MELGMTIEQWFAAYEAYLQRKAARKAEAEAVEISHVEESFTVGHVTFTYILN